MFNKTLITSAALALLLHGLPVGAAETAAAPAAAPALDGAELYKTKTCLACHGKDANTPLLPSYPKLAGQNAEYLAQQMTDIKSGKRNNGQSAAMQGVMHLVTPEEITAIAAWLATQQPAAPQP